MIRLIALLLLIAGAIIIVQSVDGLDQVQTQVAEAGAWAPILFVFLKALTYVVAPLSGSPLTIAAGPLFGIWEGTLYSVAGDTLGGSINFWISRFTKVSAVERLVGESAMRRVDRLGRRLGDWRNLLFLRIVFAGFYDVLSYAVGLTALPYRQYLAVSVIGGIPTTVLFVALAASIVEDRWTQALVLGGVVVVAMVLRIVIGRRWRNPKPDKRTAPDHEHPPSPAAGEQF
jgi:uncharacterized membrane protein YdjX (TVP38/TMEM64 family)